jgi:hypothetical protein
MSILNNSIKQAGSDQGKRYLIVSFQRRRRRNEIESILFVMHGTDSPSHSLYYRNQEWDTIKMERTIIFRTWDKNHLQMLQSPAYNIDFGAWWKEHCLDNAERENEIVFMQFTGVYDRSRKEIFEGDIINYHSASETHEKAVVHYLSQYVCFGVGENVPLSAIHHLEVIGNIFENPEDAPDDCVVPVGIRFNVVSEEIKKPSSHQ